MMSAHVARDFSRAAYGYDGEALIQRQIMERAFAKAEYYFSETAEILDIGCGTGNFARLAQDSGKKWRLRGLDIAPGMVAVAAPYYADICVGNMEALPFEDDSVASIFSSLALQWAEHPLQVFRECFRVLQPGGMAVCSSFLSQTLRELRASCEALGMQAPIIPMGDMWQYQQWVRDAGFQVATVTRIEEVQRMPSVKALFQHLRSVGATNKVAGRPKHFAAPGKFNRMMDTYTREFADERGIPVTWESIIFVIKKP